MNRFYLKPEIYFGLGVLSRLEAFKGCRVFIITDAFMVKSGTVKKLEEHLPGCKTEIFSEVVPDPPVEIITKGASRMAAFHPDAVLALGGGSSIDAAKAILETQRKLDANRKIVMIAIPTTSGTGSEVTEYAVISDPERGIKYPLRSENLIPDISLLDPELVSTVPPSVTADTGMDVITHALESYVSTGASDFSDAFAEKALSLAFTYLPRAYADGADLIAREKMHNASCIAGIAFNTAGLGLNHGIAHAVGAKLHIAHGRINAMLLPIVIEYNAGTQGSFSDAVFQPAAQRYAEVARRLGLESPTVRAGVKNLVREITRLNTAMGIPPTLRALGSDMSLFEQVKDVLVQTALADTCTRTNPRKPTPDDVSNLLRQIAG